jgi:TM2 domain-containing membrane protein YozV
MQDKNPVIAAFLSFLIPGLGQMFKGEGNKGALILAAAITIGNMIIFRLPLISMANPIVTPGAGDIRGLWAYWIPRICHDVFSVWCIAFWVWAIVDAYLITTKNTA